MSEGCDFLSNTNWAFLKKISLSDNDIGNEGVIYLVKANWTMIEEIDLSILKIF